MISRLSKLLVMILLLLTVTVSNGKTLDNYIDESCNKNCADKETLLTATKMVSDSLNIDYLILLSIIRVESSFNRKARNGSSVGLMQVHLRYHVKKFAKGDPFNPYSNIFTGASILKDCMDRAKNNLIKSFRCYNGGGDPKYAEKVIKIYSQIKQLEISTD